MMVSAPRVGPHHLSTSSAIGAVTAELPMLALTFSRERLADDHRLARGWWLAGITGRPRATLVAQLARRTCSAGGERHLGGDLPGAGLLQLGAPRNTWPYAAAPRSGHHRGP